MSETPEHDSALTREQRQRIELAAVARSVLTGRSEIRPFSVTAEKIPDAADIVMVARWLENGVDPWEIDRRLRKEVPAASSLVDQLLIELTELEQQPVGPHGLGCECPDDPQNHPLFRTEEKENDDESATDRS